jgi:hypothetical protein
VLSFRGHALGFRNSLKRDATGCTGLCQQRHIVGRSIYIADRKIKAVAIFPYVMRLEVADAGPACVEM